MAPAVRARRMVSRAMPPPIASTSPGASQEQPGLGPERRGHQHEVAIAGDDEIEDLRVAVAGPDAVAHHHAKVARQFRVGIVDRLVLADHATKLFGNCAGAGFGFGVVQHLARVERGKARHGERQQKSERCEARAHRSIPPRQAGRPHGSWR